MASTSLVSPAVLLALAVLVPAWSLVARRQPAARARALDRFARRVQLPLPAALRPALERRLLARNVGADLGGAVGLAAAALWGLTAGSDTVSTMFWWLVAAGAVFTGVAVGVGAFAWREATRPRGDDEARVARPTAPALGDYVAPVERWGAPVAALTPVVLLGVLVPVSAVTDIAAGSVASAVGAVLALTALAAAEVGCHGVLEAPQVAGSDLELAWSDALRARVLRDIVTVPIAAGTYATIGVLATVEGLEVSGTLGTALLGVLAVLAVAAVAVVVWSASSRPHRWFRRRLWPHVGASSPASSAGGHG